MSSITSSQNTSSAPVPNNTLKRSAQTDFIQIDYYLSKLKGIAEKHSNSPNLPLFQLLEFYRILEKTDTFLEVPVTDSDTETDSDSEIRTNPDHENCLLGKIEDPARAILVAGKIQDYIRRNEALFCSIISHPDFNEPSKQQDHLQLIQNTDFRFYAHISYYLTLVGDSNALPDDQITSTFVDEMLEKLNVWGSAFTDRMYSSLAVAFAKRNKCDMAIKTIEKIEFDQDKADTQFEVIEILIGHHPGSNRDDLPTLNKVLEIANAMPEDVEYYEAYYTKSIIQIAIALLERGDTSLIDSAIDWFLNALDEEWLEKEEIVHYGGLLTKPVFQVAVTYLNGGNTSLIDRAVTLLHEASNNKWLGREEIIPYGKDLIRAISSSILEEEYKHEYIASIREILEPLCTHEGG